jgi:hypothetical protein
MAEEIFMYAVTTGFFIGLVAILFGTRFRRISKSVSISTSRSGGALGGTREHTHMLILVGKWNIICGLPVVVLNKANLALSNLM